MKPRKEFSRYADSRPRIHIRPLTPKGVSWQIGPTGRPFRADDLGAAVTAAAEHFDMRQGLVLFWEPEWI